MRTWAIAVLLAFCAASSGGCLESSLIVCADQLCPQGSTCTAEGCLRNEQIEACNGKNDGDTCDFLGLPPGVCLNGNCHIAECGNGVVEEPIEVCDDRNVISGDGCSNDCKSTETCGNGYVDTIYQEQCDEGVPGFSGDGCTSSCRAEFDLWRDATPRVLSSRYGAKMVRDPVRNQIVMFGGFKTGPLDETWVFQDGAWEQRFPPSSPEARLGHAMAYFPNVGVVLFGGTNNIIHFNDTWIWGGTTWTKLPIAPTDAPTVRRQMGFAYYPPDNAIVLYGGVINSVPKDDTWKFNGTTWTKLTPSPTPAATTPMKYVQMFYDPRAAVHTKDLWLVGGDDTSGSMFHWNGTGWIYVPLAVTTVGGQPSYIDTAIGLDTTIPILFSGKFVAGNPGALTYQLDLAASTWTIISITSNPEPRHLAAMASDGTAPLVFGGQGSGGQLRTTWRFSRSPDQWTNVPTTPLPDGRFGAAAVYDGRRGDVVMFGGDRADGETNEMWRWSFPVWKLATLAPPPRTSAAMAYDEVREETVVFGGIDECGSGGGSGGTQCGSAGSGSGSGSAVPTPPTYYNDTWTLKDNTWRLEAPSTRPSKREAAAFAFDSEHGVALLFGGEYDMMMHNDTWTWDGTNWTPLAPSGSPPSMAGGRLVYDRANRKFVLYGGTGSLGSVWTFDGTVWTEVTPTTGPAPRLLPVFVYNPRRARVMMFGGLLQSGQLAGDTWEWNTATLSWEQRYPVAAPTPRYSAAAAFDSVKNHVVIFGGGGQLGTLVDDVWTYSFVSNSETPERCDGADADLDGLVGCADPDCFAHCDPYCPPASSCVTPRSQCGDGLCNPIEVGVCAGDCP